MQSIGGWGFWLLREVQGRYRQGEESSLRNDYVIIVLFCCFCHLRRLPAIQLVAAGWRKCDRQTQLNWQRCVPDCAKHAR